jgi:hypothetical protein
MSEQQIVTAAQATIKALEEMLAQVNERLERAEADKRRLEALLTRSRTSLSEQVNDPMQDGTQAAQEGQHA